MAHGTYKLPRPVDASAEAGERQLALARLKSSDLRRAFEYMINQEARQVQRQAGDYLVSFNVDAAQGEHPPAGSAHVEVSVRDAADGRLVPGLTVYATLIDALGYEIGTHQQTHLGHHWLSPYGRNWQLPGAGQYRLRVRIA